MCHVSHDGLLRIDGFGTVFSSRWIIELFLLAQDETVSGAISRYITGKAICWVLIWKRKLRHLYNNCFRIHIAFKIICSQFIVVDRSSIWTRAAWSDVGNSVIGQSSDSIDRTSFTLLPSFLLTPSLLMLNGLVNSISYSFSILFWIMYIFCEEMINNLTQLLTVLRSYKLSFH